MKKAICILIVLCITMSVFAVTDSDIRKSASTLGVPYEALRALVEKYNSSQSSNASSSNLSASFIISRLSTIPEIVSSKAVTEDHDPNGKLNKAGGYVAAVYFESKNVDQSFFDEGEDVIDKGTACGGCIEVYATVEDAEERNSTLALYDGTFFASGSHCVFGTAVVRTSDELTSTQQKNLEAAILKALK